MRKIILIAVALFFVGQGTYLATNFAFNGWFFRPDKVITVRFREVPPVIKFAGDVGVYYRGYKVGKATCKKLSNDQKYILFCVEINYKNLKLPANTQVILKSQDFFGDRYFDLVYPEKPSEKMIAHGDVVDGTAVYERVDKYLVEEMEKGELGALISNLNYLTGGARAILGGNKKELGKVSEDVTESVEDLSYITKELRTILANPEVKKDIKEAISYAPKSLKNINELLSQEDLKKIIKQAPGLLGNTVTSLQSVSQQLPAVNQSIKEVNGSIEDVDKSVEGVNARLDITNPLFSETNQQLGCLNPKIPVIPQELITQANITLKRYDCIGQSLSETASKDFLFFRFLFGRPGKSFENCINAGNGYYYCCPQNNTNR